MTCVGHGAGKLHCTACTPTAFAAGNDDTEIGARLLQCLDIDVGLRGLFFEVTDALWATRERVFEKSLRPLAGFAWRPLSFAPKGQGPDARHPMFLLDG